MRGFVISICGKMLIRSKTFDYEIPVDLVKQFSIKPGELIEIHNRSVKRWYEGEIQRSKNLFFFVGRGVVKQIDPEMVRSKDLRHLQKVWMVEDVQGVDFHLR